LSKQINEKLTKKEIEERIEFTVAEMGKVRKRIDDLKEINVLYRINDDGTLKFFRLEKNKWEYGKEKKICRENYVLVYHSESIERFDRSIMKKSKFKRISRKLIDYLKSGDNSDDGWITT